MLDPFLRWPGGKRWLADELITVLHSQSHGTYFEPFLGGGAVFFRLLPPRAVLADINDDLINTYKAIRADAEAVRRSLARMAQSANAYYRIRSSRPRLPHTRAARFLYLNRLAFSGLYRTNRRGQFSVPYGGDRSTAALTASAVLVSAGTALRGARLATSDFARTIGQAAHGDAVYCDPPYTVTHSNNGFVRYNERLFSWADQERLADCAFKAAQRGALVVVSNAAHPAVAQLYADARIAVVSRFSALAADPSCRRAVPEYLITIRGG